MTRGSTPDRELWQEYREMLFCIHGFQCGNPKYKYGKDPDGKPDKADLNLKTFHLVHVVPVSRGGGNGYKNLRPLCKK